MGWGCLNCPHFVQLVRQSSKYFSSLFRISSAALSHRLLCSVHPASLHRMAMYVQQVWASLMLKAMRFVRTRRQSSLARTHVRMYLNLLRVCSRSFWRLNSNVGFLQ